MSFFYGQTLGIAMSKILPNLKTLIVDDVRAPREVLRRLLPELGIRQIQEASGGREALNKLGIIADLGKPNGRIQDRTVDNDPFQLIISDFHLPDVSGLAVLKEVRKNPTLKDVPFIMITSEIDREEFLATKEAGVTGYILKPFSLESVKDSLQRILNVLRVP